MGVVILLQQDTISKRMARQSLGQRYVVITKSVCRVGGCANDASYTRKPRAPSCPCKQTQLTCIYLADLLST